MLVPKAIVEKTDIGLDAIGLSHDERLATCSDCVNTRATLRRFALLRSALLAVVTSRAGSV